MNAISDYTRWKHRCVSHDSWGEVYWECRCGMGGLTPTEVGAQKALQKHQQAADEKSKPMIAFLNKTKYLKRLYEVLA